MDSELKIVAINNVTFKKALESKEAFEEYRKALREMVKEHPHLDFDLRSNPTIGSIESLLLAEGITLDFEETKEGK